jgi:hypothetical protein
LPHRGIYDSSTNITPPAKSRPSTSSNIFIDLQHFEYLGSSILNCPPLHLLDTVAALRYIKVDAAERHSASRFARCTGDLP